MQSRIVAIDELIKVNYPDSMILSNFNEEDGK